MTFSVSQFVNADLKKLAVGLHISSSVAEGAQYIKVKNLT